MPDTDLGQADGLVFFRKIVIFLVERSDDLRHADVIFGIFMRGTRNNERRPGFIDEDVVHLVDDGEMMPALHALLPAHGDVIAQVIETKLAVGAVGDIRQVGLLARHRSEHVSGFG